MCTIDTLDKKVSLCNHDAQACLLETTRAKCEGLAGHSFHTCSGHTSSSCATYCWAKDLTDEESCWGAGYEVSSSSHPWPFPAQVATIPSFNFRLRRFPLLLDLLPYNLFFCRSGCGRRSGAARREGNTNVTCAAIAGLNTEWVGGTDLAAVVQSSVLQCWWHQHERCSTKASCEASGECNDWWADGGACIVPHRIVDGGRRAECPYPEYQWADANGCVVADSNGIRIAEAECTTQNYPNSVWMAGRARTSSQCLGTGEICKNSYNRWETFPLFPDKAKCQDRCEHKWESKSTWRQGTWSAAKARNLRWV